ncbi:MAG: BMP family ABC transporter substrate-binding protein [Chelatococcus sp.]|uniref:BMP family ABC transporter substrate-binding protein n=1 Tax=unclassified Chelatococcus TaxID=2638111 RepID=UPI001BCA9828|nr:MULTISPECIES: BMP family ABC transporter substrate-binding protein [unclassified Chelatococcus]CAH1651087.1 BMP family ABC transporter substrate-binding protein [Hyphomicrobiales bacterium]MBS7743220.1 BMP family ABC transporter substrate-binding protein [Chelatococcus sp. HY11]MBX3538294.1 BMP family ABC transporter substrate-binding protein [Chelatococcus sp.]MBX3541662.1 BMP family ABC transporter substrate-binding protein [Chelatococcus sp.]MCO5074446.1 BMP family ABC transporter substr
MITQRSSTNVVAAFLSGVLGLATIGPVAAADVKAAFLYVGPRADNGWTFRHDEARLCLEKAGIPTSFVESVSEGPDVARIERDFISQGYNVIFGTAFGYQPFTQQVAKQNPDKFFFNIGPGIAPNPNIQTYYGKLWDGRYLTGIVAGKMTKSNKIGFVAAHPKPSVLAGINAFTLGARSVNPKAEVNVVWTLSWFDPPAEKQAAVALAEAGNDVIAQHQDTGSAAQGAAEKGAWAIGSEADLSKIAGDRVLTGTMWDWCQYYKNAIASVKDGTFKPGDYFGGLDDDVISLAPFNKAIPADVVALVNEKKQAIIDGKFDYWKGPLKSNDGKVVVPEGGTLSLTDVQKVLWLVEGVNGTVGKK